MIVKRALRFNALIFQSKFYEKKQQNRNQDDSRIRLNDLRYEAILNLIRSLPHKESIVDLGAGKGDFRYKWVL